MCNVLDSTLSSLIVDARKRLLCQTNVGFVCRYLAVSDSLAKAQSGLNCHMMNWQLK